jgi:carbonic anhydrase/acetyltransferase-like protein (isoleucine patch superfamily)
LHHDATNVQGGGVVGEVARVDAGAVVDDSQAGGVLTIFTIEHIMVGIVVLLRVFLDKDPRWVALFKQRKAYKKEQKSLKTLYRAKSAQFQASIT